MTSSGRGRAGPIGVDHPLGRYWVRIEPGLVRRLEATVARLAAGRRVAVITDRTVERAVPFALAAPTLVVPPGERSKDRTHWARLTDRLLRQGFGRDSAIVAIGGGVVGDLAGFVAATYARGIPVIQVPTTLLAMVDASVGGKTGVNTDEGKNLIGAFHPPIAVLGDPRVLATLSEVHYRGGLAEAIKHAVIRDRSYFDWIARHRARLVARDPATLATLVRWSVRIKSSVVSADEREQGERAILNAGHTVGHAVEAASRYRVAHGDAVAIGLVAEARIGEALGHTAPGTAATIAELLREFGLPIGFPRGLDWSAGRRALRYDKKVAAGRIHCAVPARIGRIARVAGGWTVGLPPAAVEAALGIGGRRAPGRAGKPVIHALSTALRR